jgi:hypothetical protein
MTIKGNTTSRLIDIFLRCTGAAMIVVGVVALYITVRIGLFPVIGIAVAGGGAILLFIGEYITWTIRTKNPKDKKEAESGHP